MKKENLAMGMWDFEPWDNDEAADWYAGLFEAEKEVLEQRFNR